MNWIGDLWQHDVVDVGAEHLATAITEAILSRMFPRLLVSEPRSKARVMLAAVEGEHHVLGLRMVADVLEGAGFDVLYLGADVPQASLLTACAVHTPAALGLTVSMSENVPTLIAEIEGVCALPEPPAIFAAGRAVPSAIAHGLAVAPIENTEQVLAAVDQLLADGSRQALVPRTLASRMASQAVAHPPAATPRRREADGFSRTATYGAEASRDSARHAFALEQIAYRDSLTGLWNRRGYDDRMFEIVDGGASEAMVLMIDVDLFKGINDTLGHAAGDRALVEVAARMMRSVRPGDFVARYGGDEFAVVLPHASPGEASAVAERIRTTVADEMRNPVLTVSVGVAHALPSTRATALAVDHVLYAAKENGRNRVELATV
jgi:diguanylate cyclase (GGDEF)-like protein